jgi:sugar phosphate isomerase/epimerase
MAAEPEAAPQPDDFSSLRWQIGLSTGKGMVEEGFEFAAKNDIGWLELACQEPVNFPREFDAARIASVRSLIDQYAMRCVVHSASFVNTAEIMPGVREACEEHLKEYVRLTHQLGCDTLIVHAGYHFGLGLAEPIAALVQTLRGCVALAEDLGVEMVLENMNVLPPEAEIRYLGCTADEVAEILDAVDSPHLTCCLDLGHAHLLPDGARAFADRFAGRIGHVQLTDNDGIHDHHLALGDGTLDLADAFGQLQRFGYQRCIAIELSGREQQLRSLSHLDRFFGRERK